MEETHDLEDGSRIGECIQGRVRKSTERIPGRRSVLRDRRIPVVLMLRRYFVNSLLGSGMVATAASIFYPILKFVIPPDSAESAVMSVSVGRPDDIKPNSGTIFKFGG